MKANHEPLTPYEAAAKRSQMVGGSQSIRKSSLSG